MRLQRTLAVTAALLATAQALAMVTAADSVAATQQQQPLTSQQAAALSQNENSSVLVVLKNQPAAVAPSSTGQTARAKTLAGQQAPLLGELSQVHAKQVHGYQVLNAVSATVSPAEAARLAANPNVAEVVPNAVGKGTPIAPVPKPTSAATPANVLPGACPAAGAAPLIEPEGLADTHVVSADPTAETARSLGFTGSGVKVADLVDGIDINNPDYKRPDGSSVFADYIDFSDEGVNAETYGAEGFLDFSTLAAQGTVVHNVQNFSADPLPTPCDIKIEGVSPGATMYAYKLLGNNDTFNLLAAVQAIDYAVETDKVNIINESFDTNPFPNDAANDVLTMTENAAVAAGVTVTVASGDAGRTSTMGDIASNPNVITLGATTTFRFDAQTNYAGADTFATNGWLNDNISPLSSSGYTQNGGTINLVAPGDQSFVDCTPNSIFQVCVSFAGQPSDVQLGGGTSQSAPYAAGTAALVIQAYRQTHNGATPTPALIKEILSSTADDLTVPGAEQGAGLLDAYKAVEAAMSVHTKDGSPAATGSTLLVDQSQLDATGTGGSNHQFSVQVTNTGASAQTVNLSTRGFGAPTDKQTGSVTLNDSASQHFTDSSGVANNYGEIHFTVPANSTRLDASIAYPGNPNGSGNGAVHLDLIDPNGRFANESLPQGVGNYGNADVRLPTAGTWTAVIFGPEASARGTAGKVSFEADIQNPTAYGTVSTPSLTLAPGQTSTVGVAETMPTAPGDSNGSLVLNAGTGGQSSVPIVLRTLVPASGAGAFSGTLTGGNGRQTDLGQSAFYQINVPAGERDIDADVTLSSDPGDQVLAYLVDPSDNVAATGVNALTTAYDPVKHNATQQQELATNLAVRNPVAGRWTLIIDFAGATVGDELSQTYTGAITFNQVNVSAPGLPNSTSTVVPQGKPTTVQVAVHNSGTAPADYFLDPRLTPYQIATLTGEPATVPLPVTYADQEPEWLVPTETSQVTVSSTSSVPSMFQYGTLGGDPDVLAPSSGTSLSGTDTGTPLPAGPWLAAPLEPNGGSAAGTDTFTMTALTSAFDTNAVASTATDLWATSVNPVTSFKIVTVQPGQTVNIPLVLSPTEAKGTTVSGTVYVDQLAVPNVPELSGYTFYDNNPFEPTGSELVGLPYQYKVG
ncbi:MAG TPA: hypothetical protein VHZ97_01185 [Pseudonocardiaceae bacterium]|nr:hypothetical protein [Pseudonocardiaceae bacterium]